MSTRSPFREIRLDLRLDQTAMAKRLGINRSYLSELENEHREASPGLMSRLQEIAQTAVDRLGRQKAGIPIVAWAKAGVAGSYDEIPKDWQNMLQSDCPDRSAFGLMLEGDSMEPKYSAGDLVVVMPQTSPRPNGLVVANIAEQGVVFKVFAPLAEGRCRFSSINPAYPPFEVHRRDLTWIYPAYEVRHRLWQ